MPAPYSSVALKVDGTTKATAPAQPTTGAVQVNTGQHTASEAFVQAADADLYTSAGVCRLGEQVLGTVAGDGRSVTGVPVGKGEAVVCTFTNTRKARSIEVTKAVSETVNGTYDTSASKPEPGGTFYFKATIENTSAADVGHDHGSRGPRRRDREGRGRRPRLRHRGRHVPVRPRTGQERGVQVHA